MNKKTAVILLSGGLDSVVSMSTAVNQGIEIKLALTFNYGQKAFEKEYEASKNIADYYNIAHKVIELDWLKEITNTALVSDNNIPSVDSKDLNDIKFTTESMKSVWVPNRNGLFVNIAAAFCDSFGYDYIIIGANKEEAATFSDNSQQFIDNINRSLELSANHPTKVLAPLISMSKTETVKTAVKLKTPLHLINSCYSSVEGHCGKCESCNRLKRALTECGQEKIIKELFE